MSNDINYIGPVNAEWVDPAMDLPPKFERVMIKARFMKESFVYIECELRHGRWEDSHDQDWTSEVIAWLRIGGPSDSISRAQVQAAVDALRGAAKYDRIKGKYEDQPYLVALAEGIDEAREIVTQHTGVTPTEVE